MKPAQAICRHQALVYDEPGDSFQIGSSETIVGIGTYVTQVTTRYQRGNRGRGRNGPIATEARVPQVASKYYLYNEWHYLKSSMLGYDLAVGTI